jgi:uncharacterized protein (DUF58 family)
VPPFLRPLTSRGRSFGASGLVTLLCGVLTGYDELVRVGALVTVLPVLSALWVSLRPHRLEMTRSGVPVQLAVGDEAHVQLALSNLGRGPTGLILMTEQVPDPLGSSPRFLVDAMRPGWHRRVTYPIRSERRGRFEIGPVTARIIDPLGFVESRRAFPARQEVTITPRVVPLPPIPLPGGPQGSGDKRARLFLSGNPDDTTVRDYRRGDDLRRIHWPSSAHHDQLMVRREEQPWHARATLLLDTRASAYAPLDSPNDFECAVSLCASIAAHLIRRDFSVRILAGDGEELSGGWHLRGSSRINLGEVLKTLALVETIASPRLHTAPVTALSPGEMVVAVLGRCDDQDRRILASFSPPGSTATAFLLDPTTELSFPWSGIPVTSREDFAGAWQTAGSVGATAMRTRR